MAEFDACMEGLVPTSAGVLQPTSGGRPPIGVAVSGGPDSLALTALLRDWCVARGVQLVAFTVNHQLREDAGKEVEILKQQLALLNVECVVLNIDWHGEKPKASKLQLQAREHRYTLLQRACEQRGIKCV